MLAPQICTSTGSHKIKCRLFRLFASRFSSDMCSSNLGMGRHGCLVHTFRCLLLWHDCTDKSLSVSAKGHMWASVISGNPKVRFKWNIDKHYASVDSCFWSLFWVFLFCTFFSPPRSANISTFSSLKESIISFLIYSRASVARKSESILWHLSYVSLYFCSLLLLPSGTVDIEKKFFYCLFFRAGLSLRWSWSWSLLV